MMRSEWEGEMPTLHRAGSVPARRRSTSVLPLLLLLFVGCAGAPETENATEPGDPGAEQGAPSPDAIDPAVPPPPTTEDFRDRVKAIRELIEAHDYDRALAAIDETVGLGPPEDLARYLGGLRAGLKRDILQSLYVDALIVLDERRVALGTPITGQVLIVNLSNEQLTIPANAGGNETTIQLDLRYTEFDMGGTVLRERRQHPVLIGKDIVLGPGERHAEPIVLDSLEYGPQRVNYRTYRLEALMYPAEIRIGDEKWPGNLTFKPATCEVFPRNYEHLAKKPLERLDQAVAKNSPTHVPLAAALVEVGEKNRAIDKLIGFLRRDWGEDPDGSTRVACCVGLRILTGEDIVAHPDRWLEWANKR